MTNADCSVIILRYVVKHVFRLIAPCIELYRRDGGGGGRGLGWKKREICKKFAPNFYLDFQIVQFCGNLHRKKRRQEHRDGMGILEQCLPRAHWHKAISPQRKGLEKVQYWLPEQLLNAQSTCRVCPTCKHFSPNPVCSSSIR
jgi:hypothetical protein